jgi:hypothetical protein
MPVVASYREVSRFLGEISEQARPQMAPKSDRELKGSA